MANVCTPCTEAKQIPTCITSLVVGTIANLTTAVYVYIQDITTGRLVRLPVTSSGAGLVAATVSGEDFMDGHDYELWVTLASAASIEDKLSVTIEAVAYTCFHLRFTQVRDNTGAVISYSSITIDVV